MLKPNAFLKFLLILCCFSFSNLFAIDVLVAKEKIKFKERLQTKKLMRKKASKIYRHCVPVKLEDLNKTQYLAKHHIPKGSIICTKDIKKYEKSSILFDFGSIEIEKDGKIIRDTKKYIKIKKPDGKVEKIYKDGRLK